MTHRTAVARSACARPAVAVVGAAALLCAWPAVAPPARAATGDLHVHSGRLPDDTRVRVGPWSGLTQGAPDVTGTYGLTMGAAPQGASTTSTLAAPPGLSMVSATIDRALSAPVSAYHSQPQIRTSWEHRGYPYAGVSGSGGYLGDSADGTISVAHPGGLGVTLACVDFDGIAGSCGGASYTIRRLDLTLHDDEAPTVTGSVAGSLLTDGWLTGATGSLRLTAADAGAGVYRAFVREGARTWYAPADAASTRCRDAYPGNDDPYDFVPSALTLVPCPTAATQFDPVFDLAALGDGAHVVSIGIEDAGGNERTLVSDRALRVNAPGGSLPDPGTSCAGGIHDAAGSCVLSGGGGGGGGATGGAGGVTPVEAPRAAATPLASPVAAPIAASAPTAEASQGNGERASASAVLTLRVGGQRRSRMSIPYGRAVTVSGTLTTRAGRPISGAAIDVRVDRRGVTTPGGGLTTDADGAFATVLPPGASRTVRFTYRAFADDAQPTDSATLELVVQTRARLRMTPRRLRNGEAITLRGRVAGAPRGSRKLLELQVFQGRRWLTFATTRLRSGRFTYRYRFTRTAQPTRYVFRAVVPADAGWPYGTGASNHVAVAVRP